MLMILSLLHCNKTREITVFSLWQVISAIGCEYTNINKSDCV
jgi:hypothetical protein